MYLASREYLRLRWRIERAMARGFLNAWGPTFPATSTDRQQPEPLLHHETKPETIAHAEAKRELERLFTYQTLEATAARLGTDAEEVSLRYKAINDAAFAFAKLVQETVPPGADRTTANRTNRLARMWANAGIACAAK